MRKVKVIEIYVIELREKFRFVMDDVSKVTVVEVER